MPCLTYLMIWFDTVEIMGGLDQHNQFTFSSNLRRLHTQAGDFKLVSESDSLLIKLLQIPADL